MHKLAESKLMAGFIYGDPATEEYVYLPGSEVGTNNPVLIYECKKKATGHFHRKCIGAHRKTKSPPDVPPDFRKTNFMKKDCGRFYRNRSLFT